MWHSAGTSQDLFRNVRLCFQKQYYSRLALIQHLFEIGDALIVSCNAFKDQLKWCKQKEQTNPKLLQSYVHISSSHFSLVSCSAVVYVRVACILLNCRRPWNCCWMLVQLWTRSELNTKVVEVDLTFLKSKPPNLKKISVHSGHSGDLEMFFITSLVHFPWDNVTLTFCRLDSLLFMWPAIFQWCKVYWLQGPSLTPWCHSWGRLCVVRHELETLRWGVSNLGSFLSGKKSWWDEEMRQR